MDAADAADDGGTFANMERNMSQVLDFVTHAGLRVLLGAVDRRSDGCLSLQERNRGRMIIVDLPRTHFGE